MRKLAVFFLAALLFLPASYILAKDADPIVDEQTKREALESINEENVKKEGAARYLTKYPQTASGVNVQIAASGRFAWFNDTFDIYVVRSEGYVWLYIVPVSGYPFICSSSFTIIQDGIQYDSVKLLKATGDSQCNDVYISQLYLLTFWSFVSSWPDFSRAFTLLYDAQYVYTLNVPAGTLYPESDPGIASTGVEGFVTRFYQLCLNRNPEPSGLNGWVDALNNGTLCGADVAYGFVFSLEFVSQNKSNEEYVTILYEAFFNRAPDPDGFNGWVNALNTGMSRSDVLYGFTHAQEFNNLCDEFGIRAN